jgi:hypothetical protein
VPLFGLFQQYPPEADLWLFQSCAKVAVGDSAFTAAQTPLYNLLASIQIFAGIRFAYESIKLRNQNLENPYANSLSDHCAQ